MRIVAIAAAALVVAAPAAGTVGTGFQGRVTIGPLTPVCSDTTPCSGPARDVTLSFWRNGVVVRRVVTSGTGTYRVLLRYGQYTVRANAGMRISPTRVWAHRGLLARLNFAIDTGIR